MICGVCRKQFESSYSLAKYCSDECRHGPDRAIYACFRKYGAIHAGYGDLGKVGLDVVCRKVETMVRYGALPEGIEIQPWGELDEQDSITPEEIAEIQARLSRVRRAKQRAWARHGRTYLTESELNAALPRRLTIPSEAPTHAD